MAGKTALLLVLALALAVGACGTSAPSHRTLHVATVPFGFDYPAGFREATDASLRKANAIAAVGPTANSYIAVRRNGPALSVDALERQAINALGGGILRKSRERHSGIDMVAVTVADTGGERLGLRSRIYGFSLRGGSWLIECHSTAADRDRIDAACRQALGSIKETS